MFAKKIAVLVLITGRDEFLEPKPFEIVREIMKEIAHARIVAVAKNNFVPEMVLVMPEFLFNIGKLSIKLVLLRVLSGV